MGKFAAKAAQGKFANKVVTTYKAYLDNPEIARQDNPVRNKPPSKVLYIEPFSFDLAENQYVKVSASSTVVTAQLGAVNTGGTRTMATLATSDTAIRLDRFRPAKIMILTGRSTTGTDKVSKTSGLPYKAYGGNRSSIPFGRKATGEDQNEAFNIIKTAIQEGQSATSMPIVTLMPEKYTG